MRRLACLILAVAVLAACNGDTVSSPLTYDPCAGQTTQDTVFQLWPDSMRLVMGGADEGNVDWFVMSCEYVELTPSEITWTVRDPAVIQGDPVGFGTPAFLVTPKQPGTAWLVAEGGRWVDSLRVVVPDTVPMPPSVSLAAGGQTTCSVTEAGETFCWGTGESGLLGGGYDPYSHPSVGTCWGIPCSPMPVPRASGVASVQVGGWHVCGLTAAGDARCWGSNVNYQLGASGGPDVRSEPVEAGGGATYASLTLGQAHTCGLTEEGEAYCWGDHWGGRLGGDQRSGPVATPVQVSPSLRFSSLDASFRHTCGTSVEGGLYCWGYLPHPAPPGSEVCEVGGGKGGTTSVPCSYVPLRMPIDAGLGADSLFVQVREGCALTSEGSVFCRDDGTDTFSPRDGFGPYATLVAGEYHTCGLTVAGVAECWGNTSSGALGHGTGTPSFTPVAVQGGHVFVELAAGQAHTCGRTTDGTVWCWGENQVGQAGVSVLERPLSPMKVRGQG